MKVNLKTFGIFKSPVSIKSTLLTSAMFGVITLAAGAANAHEGGLHPKKQMMQMMRQLDLSRDQKRSVRSVMRDTKDEVSLLREDLQQMRSEMLNLIESGNVSQESVDGVIDQYAETLRELVKTQGNTKNAIYVVLDDEQREKAQNLMEEKQARIETSDPEKRLEKITDKLDLTDEQQQTANEVLPAIVEARTAMRETRKGFREAQRDLITSGTYTEEQLDVLFDEYFPEFKVNLLAVIESHQAVYLMLDDDQKDKLQGLRGKMMKRLF